MGSAFAAQDTGDRHDTGPHFRLLPIRTFNRMALTLYRSPNLLCYRLRMEHYSRSAVGPSAPQRTRLSLLYSLAALGFAVGGPAYWLHVTSVAA